MLLVGLAIYWIGLVVLLSLACLFRILHVVDFIREILRWSLRYDEILNEKAEYKQEDTIVETFHPPNTTAQEYPLGWWTDETNFQIERRAIFNQVGRF